MKKTYLLILFLVQGLINQDLLADGERTYQRSYASRSPGSHGATFNEFRLHIGPGFIVAGSASPGVGLGVDTKIFSDSVYVGLDSGLFLTTGPFAIQIPLMPMITAYYKSSTSLQLHIGVAFGPYISLGGGSAFSLAMWFKPGISFVVSSFRAFFEIRSGVIGSAFVFYPQLGATFRI